MKGLSVTVGSGRHRQQKIILINWHASMVFYFINKEARSMEREKV